MIRQSGKGFNLYTKDGSRVLGKHKSYISALRQERAIYAAKARAVTG